VSRPSHRSCAELIALIEGPWVPAALRRHCAA
jgi:hypothetical protein